MTILFDHFIYGVVFISFGWIYGHYTGKRTGKVEAECKNFLEKLRQLEEDKIDFPHNCRWQCYVCKRWRIDCLIGVARYASGNEMVVNIKYCKDSPQCVKQAHDLAYWYGNPVTLKKAGE